MTFAKPPWRRLGARPEIVTGFLGSATVGAKGQIAILADAREAMQIKEGDKVVALRGPRGGSILVSGSSCSSAPPIHRMAQATGNHPVAFVSAGSGGLR